MEFLEADIERTPKSTTEAVRSHPHGSHDTNLRLPGQEEEEEASRPASGFVKGRLVVSEDLLSTRPESRARP